jgi:predicted enzyme related to lactoylglutathione lyase
VDQKVEDFDAAVARLRAHGAKFRMEPFPTPVCHIAMIFDPSGNTLCIHKRNVG